MCNLFFFKVTGFFSNMNHSIQFQYAFLKKIIVCKLIYIYIYIYIHIYIIFCVDRLFFNKQEYI